MTSSFCVFALVISAGTGCDEESSASAAKLQIVADARLPAYTGYVAEVEVTTGGVTRYGRIIVTRDGGVHLEHLDEHTVRWVRKVLRQQSSPSMGWDDRPLRTGPVRSVWKQLGQHDVLTEIHTADAAIQVIRHQLLFAR